MNTLKDKIFTDIKVNNNDNYLIFNEGGIGKTTQMKAAYLELTNSHIDKIVPIFIDCKSLNYKSNYPLLSAILEKYCGNDCMESTHRETLEKLICNETPQNGSYKFIIFIDGINECESNKYKVLQDITELLKSPNNKIVVSSRINEDEFVFKDFKKLKVKEFTDEQIITYLNTKGFNYNGINIELNRLNPSLLKILRIPMFLKLFAETYSNKHIFPDIYATNIVRKADLLQGFLDKILNDKLEQYQTKNMHEYRERKFALNLFLPALAYEMSLKSSFSMSEKELTFIIDNKFSYEYFKKLVNLNNRKLIQNIDYDNILDICKDEFSLITLSNNSYAFGHQVWQDFFCANFYTKCIERDIIDVFDNYISTSVRQFIGEIVKNDSGECECDFEKKDDLKTWSDSPIEHFLQKHNLNSSTPLSSLQTFTLIEIMKTSRDNNITADYSNLDLKNVNFYKCDLENSTFNGTHIYDINFIKQGHTDWVTSVAFSPDGTKIVSGSWDHTIRIWDVKTGLQIGEPLTGHTGSVYSVAFSPDGTKIVSGSADHTIIWDAKTGSQIGNFSTGDKGRLISISPNGKKIVSGSGDTIRIWDVETGLPIGEPLTGHTGTVTSVAFSPDGTKIVSGSWDHTIRIWDAKTGSQIGNFSTGDKGRLISISPNGKKIVSGSGDTIRIWDVETGLPIGEPLTGHTGTVTSVAFSPDGTKIVSGSADHTIRIWDAKTGLQIGEPLEGNTGKIVSVSFSPNGAKIVSGSYDHTVRIWDAETGVQTGKPFTGHTRIVSSVSFSPDGAKIASGSYDDTVRIWDIKTGSQIGEPLMGHISWVNSVAFSPDGTKIVSGSSDKTIRIWDVKTGLQIGEPLTGHTGGVYSVAFSPDGTKIVSGSADHTIIWDAETFKLLGEPYEGGTVAAFSPDGKRIAIGSYYTIKVLDTKTGIPVLKDLQGNKMPVQSLSFSPDGKKIVSGNVDGAVRMWNAETSIYIGKLNINSNMDSEDNDPIPYIPPVDLFDMGVDGEDTISSIVFSPDGRKIVSGGFDETIKIWNLESHLCTIIYNKVQSYIGNCDFRNADYNGKDKDEFYKIIYSNGGLVKDEFKPKPIPFKH